jgi:uncharacterized protein with PIN domain
MTFDRKHAMSEVVRCASGDHPAARPRSYSAGTMCAQCGAELTGKSVRLRGSTVRVHARCFVCSHCATSLFEGNLADRPPAYGHVKKNDRGELLCFHCFELHTRSCDACGGSLADVEFAEVKLPSGGEILMHRKCIRCSRCSALIVGSFALSASEELVCADCLALES